MNTRACDVYNVLNHKDKTDGCFSHIPETK